MKRWRGFTWLLGAMLLGLAFQARGAVAQHAGHGDHRQGFERSVQRYEVPEVILLSQDREEVRLDELVGSGRPVLVDFIFATCTTICPVLSAGFSNLQKELGDDAGRVRLISITIDPEHDTPEVMKRYLERYRARPGWDFFTADRASIERVMRAFDAYVPDKMSHRPLIFLRAPGDEQWVRLLGFLSTRELMAEVRGLLEP